jgi:hypothetical protein
VGLPNQVKLAIRKSFGCRTANVAKRALFYNLGRLPEPERTPVSAEGPQMKMASVSGRLLV